MLLGLKSDFVVMHLSSQLFKKETYFVLKTPSQPHYHFGNLIAFNNSIANITPEEALAIFNDEFSDIPELNHQTFIWPRSEINEDKVKSYFIEMGFRFNETHILSTNRNHITLPDVLNESVEYRKLKTQQDWNGWKDLECDTNKEHAASDTYEAYLDGQIENYKALERSGFGYYLGAFIGQKLVGHAGLYHYQGLARFQYVAVDEAYRNLGIAKSLITQLINDSPSTTTQWVIHADENYFATQLYQNLGFTVAERQCDLCRW